MSEKVVLKVAALRDAVAGEMEDSTGTLHNVLSITFDQQQALMAAEEGLDEMTRVRRLVRQLVPTLTETELGSYNLEQAKAISAVSTAGIRAVERAFPNAVGPASVTSPA